MKNGNLSQCFKKHRFLALLLFLLGTVLVLIVLISDDSSGKTLVVDAGGNGDYTVIQEAVDNADEGDIVRVWAGVYERKVIIDKSLSLIGNGSEATIIDALGKKIAVTIEADWCNVSGFNVTNTPYFEDGIRRSEHGMTITSNHTTISNNTISTIRNGIVFNHSSNNTISNNNFPDNGYHNILLFDTSNSTVSNNTCSGDSGSGIYLDGSDSNTLSNNTITNCETGILFDHSSYNNTVSNNTISNNGANGILLLSSSNNTVSNNIVSNNICKPNKYGLFYRYADGIHLWGSNHNTFSNNVILSNGDAGVKIANSRRNTLFNNTIAGNNIGITLEKNAQNNNANYNRIFNNTGWGIDASENSDQSINASYNFWGSNSGPYHPGKNHGKKGDNMAQSSFPVI